VKNETENPIGFHQCAEDFIELIEAVENVSTVVYDTYPQVVVKLNHFLARDGVTKTRMCKVLGGIYQEKLDLFLSGEYVYKGNEMYKAAYLFFEKLGSWRARTRVRIEWTEFWTDLNLEYSR